MSGDWSRRHVLLAGGAALAAPPPRLESAGTPKICLLGYAAYAFNVGYTRAMLQAALAETLTEPRP